MSSSTARVSLKILLLTSIILTVSGDQQLTITPGSGTTINISSTQASRCSLCRKNRFYKTCVSSLLLKDTAPVSVLFKCSNPQDVFRVEIVRNIECNKESCSGQIIQADYGSLPLLDFNRKFTWNLNASAAKAFKIDFTKTGLRQIHPSEICPDRHSYTMQASQTGGSVTIGKYCRAGIISSAQILNAGSFSLEVPAGQKLLNGQFDVSVGEEIKSLAKMTLTFPSGTSSTDLLSPNYPDSFPNDDLMEWYFQVPDKHKTSVQFLNLTQPHCLKKDTAVEYRSKGSNAIVHSLMDSMQDQNWANITLTLRSCEMDRTRSGSPGLSVNLKVSTCSTSSPGLPKNWTLSSVAVSVVTAVLAIFVIVAAMVCVVIRKKIKKHHQMSINNPNSTSVVPGHSSSADSEPHVYATIDETLVYSHLLKDCAEVQDYMDFDSNQSVSGHRNMQNSPASKDSGVYNMEFQDYHSYTYTSDGNLGSFGSTPDEELAYSAPK